MIETLKKRIAHEESGFTLIELLVVIIILGILLAIAVPSYLGLKDRADKSAAQSNIRAIVPDIEQYNADNVVGAVYPDNPDAVTYGGAEVDITPGVNSGYVAISADELKAHYDQAIDATKYKFTDMAATATDYCVSTTSGKFTAYKHGPSNAIKVTPTSSYVAATCTGP